MAGQDPAWRAYRTLAPRSPERIARGLDIPARRIEDLLSRAGLIALE